MPRLLSCLLTAASAPSLLPQCLVPACITSLQQLPAWLRAGPELPLCPPGPSMTSTALLSLESLPLQPHWIPGSSPVLPGMLSPLSLGTHHFLCLECSSCRSSPLTSFQLKVTSLVRPAPLLPCLSPQSSQYDVALVCLAYSQGEAFLS